MRVQITNPNLEVRSCGPHSADVVRSMMAKSHLCDFRQLGCPDRIFQSVLEKRAKHARPISADVPAQNDKREWMALAIHALAQKDAIAADRLREQARLEARADNWNQAAFDELKAVLRVLDSNRSGVDACLAAERRLRQLLAA